MNARETAKIIGFESQPKQKRLLKLLCRPVSNNEKHELYQVAPNWSKKELDVWRALFVPKRKP